MMFLCSGSREVFEAHRSTLTTLGNPLHLGTDPASPPSTTPPCSD